MAKEKYKTGKVVTQEVLDDFRESLQDEEALRIKGKCCNCKREFSYSPEFCVDLVCRTCAAHLPEDIKAFIEHNTACKALGLVKILVNSFDFNKGSLEDWRTVMNTVIDLGTPDKAL